MRPIWEFHRRAVIGACLAGILVVAGAVAALGGHRGGSGSGQTSPRQPSAAASRPDSSRPAVARDGPLRVSPADSQTQQQTDSELARSESAASIAQANRETMPAAATSAAYPAIPASAESDPTAFALAFASELLDVDSAVQSRAGLLEWAEFEEAPDTLPGVPASIADKSLVGSLAYSGVAGSEPSPVPAAAGWPKPDSGTVQQVSGLAAVVAPDWTQLVSAGWEPVDPLMTIMVVTGTITVTTDGRPGPPRSFSLALSVGGARHYPGYGAVAVSAWTVAGTTGA
jgi:hypothetical protein